ncbi:MAG: hypothetical protein KC418_22525 [Anaerolineales bacterium]|nr:hypothetical protein [Anaerolineales bacterium]MCB8951541.1 hypothetical protein [Ardenticatenales bacterium]
MDEDVNTLKHEEQQGRERRQRDSNWLVGGILVLLGIIFLLGNYGGVVLQNWWALFILIPAVSNLSSAWNDYRTNGHLTHRGRNGLTWGLVILATAIVFLLNLNWGVVWPIFLIIIGLGSLLTFFSRQEAG